MATITTPQDNSGVLPDPARYVTDNNAEAKSEFSHALPSPMAVTHGAGKSLVRLAYTVPTLPARLGDQTDIKAFQENLSLMKAIPPLLPPGGGGSVWYVDHPPGTRVPMHRTVTLDIIIQVSGEIELELESGEKKVLRPGDIAVQRSTVHAWHNPSETEWARLVAVTLPSEPVQIGGQTLGDQFPARPPVESA